MGRSTHPGPLLVLVPEARLQEEGGQTTLLTSRGSLSLGLLPGAVGQVLAAARTGISEQEALRRVREEGLTAEAYLHFSLSRLGRFGALRYVVQGASAPLATLEATTRWFELSPRQASAQGPWRLSRFALLRREGAELVLESARVPARVCLHHPSALQLAWALARPLSLDEAVHAAGGEEEGPVHGLVLLLVRAGFLLPTDGQGLTEEEREPELATWEFHDRLLHVRSRGVPLQGATGATYRLKERFAPLPALPPPREPSVTLPQPDLERLIQEDPPLAAVMERRHSAREYGARPPSLQQLGELLYRCARVRERLPSTPYERSRRTYPSGGACYPLEVYLAVSACEGLEPGLFHYAPQTHQLEWVRERGPALEELLESGRVGSQLPQVLLILTARFQRVAWKYESIAYSLVLKEAGVLLHSLHLAATAIGLASCAVGFGDAEAFARAARVNSHAEPCVAEVALGSLPNKALTSG